MSTSHTLTVGMNLGCIKTFEVRVIHKHVARSDWRYHKCCHENAAKIYLKKKNQTH